MRVSASPNRVLLKRSLGKGVAAYATASWRICLLGKSFPLVTLAEGCMTEKANLKIHLFRVQEWEETEPLRDLLARIDGDELESRIRRVSGGDCRLEDIKPPASGSSLWELNFVRMRSGHGPGKVSRNARMEGFEMGEEDYFGEDTAVLYDQATGYAVVQYNHWGVRPNAIQDYLSRYRDDVTNLYSLKVKLDLNAERKYEQQAIKRRIEIGIDLTKMQEEDLHARRSLTQVVEAGRAVGADRIYITMTIASGGKGASLLEEASHFITSARHWFGGEKDALRSLKSYGAEDEDKPYEEIDLLSEKIESVLEVSVGTDRRITLDDRMRALKRAKSAWSALMT